MKVQRFSSKELKIGHLRHLHFQYSHRFSSRQNHQNHQKKVDTFYKAGCTYLLNLTNKIRLYSSEYQKDFFWHFTIFWLSNVDIKSLLNFLKSLGTIRILLRCLGIPLDILKINTFWFFKILQKISSFFLLSYCMSIARDKVGHLSKKS